MLKRILFLFAMVLMASPFLFAQITTSSINGTVKGASDEALVGATVVEWLRQGPIGFVLLVHLLDLGARPLKTVGTLEMTI